MLEAEILLRQLNNSEAMALLTDRALATATRADLVIRRTWMLGLANARLSHPAEGDAQLREAQRLAAASHSPLIGEVLRADGLVARDAGNLALADENFRSSRSAAHTAGDALLEASDLGDIGEDQLERNHFDQALAQLQTAAQFARSAQAARQLQLATGNLGWAYYNLGDFERALDQFQQAERQARQIGMTRNRTLWLQDAGLADYKLGALEQARRYEEQALQALSTRRPGGDIDQVTNIETNLALLLYEQGRYPEARGYAAGAERRAAQSRDNNVVAYVRFVQGLLTGQQGGEANAEQTLLSARDVATDPDLRTDIEAALAGQYASGHAMGQAQFWYARAIQTFENKRSAEHDEALRLAAFGYGTAVYSQYATFLIDSHRPEEALRLLDRGRARTLAEGIGFSEGEREALEAGGTDPRSVARKLDATILFYALGSRQSYLWAITPGQTRLFTLPAAKEIESQVAQYQRAILRSSDPLQTTTPAAASLYEELIGPAAAMIRPDSKVILIPDGILHTLNFETLLQPAAGGFRYWIENVTITTASSIRMLASSKPDAPDGSTHELLLIGDPLAIPGELSALPHAADEIQRVAGHFAAANRTVLTQAQAMPPAYAQSDPEQYRYIHFVAHGTASRLSPLDSAIVLSPQRDRPDDFKLYARDIVQYPLKADLVTISTCYGSGIRTYAGEGLVGLAWVFLRAGAHNVIGALWEADDASTPLLMDRLYAELRAGKAPDVALRAAKLSFIRSNAVYRKPFYWAPFQLYAGS